MRCILFTCFIMLCLVSRVQAESGFTEALQTLKQQSLSLDRDLLLLEEKITQPLSIYLSLQVDAKFVLQSMTLTLDNKPLLNVQYTDIERQAMAKGGAQLLYRGALPEGEHQLIAYYQSDKGYQGGSKFSFRKDQASQVIEIQILRGKSRESRLQPSVVINTVAGNTDAK